MTDDTPTNVTPLFPQGNQLAPDYELQAQYLEAMAKEIREKQVSHERCILIMQPPSGELGIYPFGGHATNIEFVGLLEFYQVVR